MRGFIRSCLKYPSQFSLPSLHSCISANWIFMSKRIATMRFARVLHRSYHQVRNEYHSICLKMAPFKNWTRWHGACLYSWWTAAYITITNLLISLFSLEQKGLSLVLKALLHFIGCITLYWNLSWFYNKPPFVDCIKKVFSGCLATVVWWLTDPLQTASEYQSNGMVAPP